jgi:hypothetical protein
LRGWWNPPVRLYLIKAHLVQRGYSLMVVNYIECVNGGW